MVSKVRILVSVLVIAIIGILLIPNESDNSKTITTVYESDIVSSDDINMDQSIIDQAIQDIFFPDLNLYITRRRENNSQSFIRINSGSYQEKN